MNEIDFGFWAQDGHNASIQVRAYTRFYDWVVQQLQRDHADLGLKYHGLVLADILMKSAGTEYETDAEEYFHYFLNRSNHAADVPLDYVSYHW